MRMMKLILNAFLLLSAGTTVVDALPTGAAGCAAGQAAVGGGHVSRLPGDLGVLENGGFVVSINGEPVTDPSTPVDLSPGVDYTISLSGADFLGFLFRLGSDVDTADFLSPGDIGDPQPTPTGICPEDVAGVTHSLNDAKAEATAVLNADVAGTYSLDVTVVTRNCSPESPVLGAPNDIVTPCTPADSTYFYTGYTLTFVEPTPAPVTSAPVTTAPVTSAPVTFAPATMAPVTSAPVTTAPVTSAPLTPAPMTAAPAPAPVEVPTSPPPPVVMPSPDGEACWSSTQAITITEVFAIFDPNLAAAQRTYIMCPNSTIQIGTQTGGLTFEGGELPIGVFLPGLHVQCGESGLSSDSCTLEGGQEQITSLGDEALLLGFLSLLPVVAPGLPAYPEDLPEDFALDSSNLLIEGMTFSGFSNQNLDNFIHSPLYLAGPGDNIIIKDCIFMNGSGDHAINIAFLEELWSGEGKYISTKIQDCLFKDNSFKYQVISQDITCPCSPSANTTFSAPVTQIDVDNCLFESNIARSAIMLEWAEGSITNSCFIDTNVTKGSSLIETYNSLDVAFENIFDSGTSFTGNVTCENIAVYETVGLPELGNAAVELTMCIDFDAEVCAVNGATAPPTAAPVAPSDAPVESPTDAPVENPTDAPMEPPTDAPTTSGAAAGATQVFVLIASMASLAMWMA